jgi:hypothetical protein
VGKLAGKICQPMTDEQINELADNLDCGLRSFVHRHNLTIVTIPDTDDPESDSKMSDSYKEIEGNFNNYLEIEKMNSNDSFRLMTNFVETIDNRRLKEKLDQILSRPKPFKNFKLEIDNSGHYRQKWFEFKNQQLIEWVKGQLTIKGL